MKTVNSKVWKFAAVADKLLFLNAIPSVCLLANCNIVIAPYLRHTIVRRAMYSDVQSTLTLQTPGYKGQPKLHPWPKLLRTGHVKNTKW